MGICRVPCRSRERRRGKVPGHSITVRGVMRIWVRDGLVAHRTDYYDALGFLKQIGKA